MVVNGINSGNKFKCTLKKVVNLQLKDIHQQKGKYAYLISIPFFFVLIWTGFEKNICPKTWSVIIYTNSFLVNCTYFGPV